MKPLYMIGCINEIGGKQKADNVSGFLGETGFREYISNPVPTWKKGYLLRVGIEINEKFSMEYGDLY